MPHGLRKIRSTFSLLAVAAMLALGFAEPAYGQHMLRSLLPSSMQGSYSAYPPGTYPITIGQPETVVVDPNGGPVYLDDCPPQACPPMQSFDPYAGNCEAPCQLPGVGTHRSGIFGEYLYLRPRGVNVPYALPQDGIGFLGSVPLGDVALTEPDYDHGFRIGGAWAIDCDSSIVGAYTWYENSTDSSVAILDPLALNPLLLYPGTFNAGFTALAATASYGLDFDFIDLDYRTVLVGREPYAVNGILGVRYASLNEDYFAVYPFVPPDTETTVETHIDFNGVGFRAGLDGERRINRNWGFLVYGRAIANILAGTFRATYDQANAFSGTEVRSTWSENRIVSILETEVGLGWMSPKGHFRFSAGYRLDAWFNAVTTPDWIAAVQETRYRDLDDSIVFSGLVARAEVNF